MVNRYRPAGDGIMRPVPAKSHLCATYVDAHDYAALEARNAEQFRLMGQYMENAEAAHERIAELEAALRKLSQTCNGELGGKGYRVDEDLNLTASETSAKAAPSDSDEQA